MFLKGIPCCNKSAAIDVVEPTVGDSTPGDIQTDVIISLTNVTNTLNTEHMNAMGRYQTHETYEIESTIYETGRTVTTLNPLYVRSKPSDDNSQLDKSFKLDDNSQLDKSFKLDDIDQSDTTNNVIDLTTITEVTKPTLDVSIAADPNTTLDESSAAGSYNLDDYEPVFDTTLDKTVSGHNKGLHNSYAADPNTTLDESSVAGPKIHNRTI